MFRARRPLLLNFVTKLAVSPFGVEKNVETPLKSFSLPSVIIKRSERYCRSSLIVQKSFLKLLSGIKPRPILEHAFRQASAGVSFPICCLLISLNSSEIATTQHIGHTCDIEMTTNNFLNSCTQSILLETDLWFSKHGLEVSCPLFFSQRLYTCSMFVDFLNKMLLALQWIGLPCKVRNDNL